MNRRAGEAPSDAADWEHRRKPTSSAATAFRVGRGYLLVDGQRVIARFPFLSAFSPAAGEPLRSVWEAANIDEASEMDTRAVG